MKETLNILKQAILLERRGQAFYRKVAEQTDNEDVRKIFDIMAEEEKLHEAFLVSQYKSFQDNGRFVEEDLPNKDKDGISNLVLSEDMKKSIGAASYEASAISAAIDMETKAIKIYADHAEKASDPNEKKLFQWLSDWEKTHHKILHDLDEELKERVWQDNNFWPF
ncbi:MAG: ferritin-like domain-containing protein [Bacteroidales bacterium]